MKRMHARPKLIQWTVALVLLIVFVALFTMAVLVTASVLGLQPDNPAQLAVALAIQLGVLLPLWMMAAIFFLAPVLRLVGALRYYSPYLIVTRSRGGGLDLHGATLFDYLLLFQWSERGRPAVRKILIWYVEGLLALVREIEKGDLPDNIVLSATSYIFSKSIARRYGFHVETGSRFSVGGFLTYPTQLITYSFAKGRWAFPPILRARRATIPGAALAAQSARLQRLRNRLLQARDLKLAVASEAVA
jgi:hypothetical protein